MSRRNYYSSGYDASGYDANGYDDRGYKAGQDGPSYQIFNSSKSNTLRYTSSRDGPGYVMDLRAKTPEITEFRGHRRNTEGYPESARDGRSPERRRNSGTSKQYDGSYETEYRAPSLPQYRDSKLEGGRSPPRAYRPQSPARTYETDAAYRPRSRSRRRSRERRHNTGRSPRRDSYPANSRRHRTARTDEPTYEPERSYGRGREDGPGTTVRQYVDESGRPIAKVKRMDRDDDGGYSSRYEPERSYGYGRDSGAGTTVRQYVDESGRPIAKVKRMDPGDDIGPSRRYAPERSFAYGRDDDAGTTLTQYVDESGTVVAKVYEPDDGAYSRRY